MIEPQTQKEGIEGWNIVVDEEGKEQAQKEKESQEAFLAELDRMKKENSIPVRKLEPLKVIEEPMHLNLLETELFRFFEVNRDRAFTFEGVFIELDDLETRNLWSLSTICDPKARSKTLDTLKDMVLSGRLGGDYDKNKRDYFYYFKPNTEKIAISTI